VGRNKPYQAAGKAALLISQSSRKTQEKLQKRYVFRIFLRILQRFLYKISSFRAICVIKYI
jgi:hypothetical protein